MATTNETNNTTQEYEVVIKLKSDFPRDVNEDGEMIWWNTESIGDEIYAWLDDLGFEVKMKVKEV
jgi:hypothetical protein